MLTRVLGGVLMVLSISFWLEMRRRIKRRVPYTYTTGFQTILLSFTSLTLLTGGRLWVLAAATASWFLMQALVLSHRDRAMYYLLAVVLAMAAEFSWVMRLSTPGWVVSLIMAAVLYEVALYAAFPGAKEQ